MLKLKALKSLIFFGFLLSTSVAAKESVDIGVFYTKDVLQQYSKQEVHALLERRTEWANVALENSGIDLVRNIVLFEQSPIDNNGYGVDDYWAQLILNDEMFDSYIDAYGLDYITVFIVTPTYDSTCGTAHVGGRMSVIQLSDGCNESYNDPLLAHEWGHLDGADHDIDDGYLQKKPYGLGYHCDETSTIMSLKFNVANRHQIYSNPQITINNDECGVEDVADVSRMIRERMNEPGAIQNTEVPMEILSPVSFQMSATTVNETDGTIDGKVVIPNALEKEVSVQVFTELDSASRNDIDPFMERIVISAGKTEASFSIIVHDDNEFENDETFNVGIRYGQGVEVDSGSVEVQIISDDSPQFGKFGFEFAEYSVVEGEEQVIRIVRVDGVDTEVTLNLSVSNDLITLITDSVTFADGESIQEVRFTVNPLSDGSLSEISIEPGDYELGETRTAVVGAERIGKFSFAESSVAITAGQSEKLKIVRAGGSYGEVNLVIEVSGSGITLDGDGHVVFQPGQLEGEVVISAAGDSGNSEGIVKIVSGAVVVNEQVSVKVEKVVVDSSGVNNSSSSNGGGGSFGWSMVFLLLVALRSRLTSKTVQL